MLTSVIICTRNRCEALRDTLRPFAAVSIPQGLEVELIIVDNGSTDETPNVVKAINVPGIAVHYVHEAKVGKSAAQNTGVAFSRGEITVFTDDDVRPDPRWLEYITSPIADGRFDALAGTVRIAPHLIRPWMTEQHKAWLASTDYLNPVTPEALVSANMAIARRVLERVPRFDPELGPGRLGFWDDTLFSMQLKHAGYRIGMVPDAVVEHHFDRSRLSRKSFLARAEGEGRSLAYVTWHWKHENRAWPLLRARRRELELSFKRKIRANEWTHPEGIPTWEMELAMGIAFLRHFAAFRKQPRLYAKHGFLKS